MQLSCLNEWNFTKFGLGWNRRHLYIFLSIFKMDNLLLRKKDKSNDIFDWNSYYFKSLCINCFKLGFFKVFKCLHNSDHAWNTQQRFFLDLLSESHTLSFFGYFSASKSCNVYSMRFYSNDDSTQIMDHTTQRSMFDNKKNIFNF